MIRAWSMSNSLDHYKPTGIRVIRSSERKKFETPKSLLIDSYVCSWGSCEHGVDVRSTQPVLPSLLPSATFKSHIITQQRNVTGCASIFHKVAWQTLSPKEALPSPIPTPLGFHPSTHLPPHIWCEYRLPTTYPPPSPSLTATNGRPPASTPNTPSTPRKAGFSSNAPSFAFLACFEWSRPLIYCRNNSHRNPTRLWFYISTEVREGEGQRLLLAPQGDRRLRWGQHLLCWLDAPWIRLGGLNLPLVRWSVRGRKHAGEQSYACRHSQIFHGQSHGLSSALHV